MKNIQVASGLPDYEEPIVGETELKSSRKGQSKILLSGSYLIRLHANGALKESHKVVVIR